jgi:hypothetical protein
MSFEMKEAAWMHTFRGETCAGRGDVEGLYFRKGRNRWIYRRWKNML